MAGVTDARPYLKLVLLVAILAAAWLLVRTTALGEYFTRDGMVDALQALRSSMWAPVIFVTVYSLATALALPGSLLTIVGGAVSHDRRGSSVRVLVGLIAQLPRCQHRR
jgi:uncharacterized membrane protein YdjX (TVP38/TMEM64 family)